MMTDDDRPPIDLAVERGKREREFTAERELLIKELLAIGLPIEKTTAIAQEMLFYDWLCLQAVTILGRWDLEVNAESAVELVKIMRGLEIHEMEFPRDHVAVQRLRLRSRAGQERQAAHVGCQRQAVETGGHEIAGEAPIRHRRVPLLDMLCSPPRIPQGATVRTT